MPQARAKQIEMTDAVSGYAAGLSAIGDEQRVRQILINLLANAVKFTTARGDEPGRVTISAGAAKSAAGDANVTGAGPWIYIRVEDTGRGIRPDQLRAVFGPFVQEDMTLTREYGGTGLGLAISRRLARLMGGDLTVRSEPGLGSAFFLWLPAAPVESLQTGGVRGHGPPGTLRRDEERSNNDEVRAEAGTRPTILEPGVVDGWCHADARERAARGRAGDDRHTPGAAHRRGAQPRRFSARSRHAWRARTLL